jgi:hypothetical protein
MADEARLGAIIEIGPAPSAPRPADRNIAELAKYSGEYPSYSPAEVCERMR